MENKSYILMTNKPVFAKPLAIFNNRTDIEELILDFEMEEEFDRFCWYWLYFEYEWEECIGGMETRYWIVEVPRFE